MKISNSPIKIDLLQIKFTSNNCIISHFADVIVIVVTFDWTLGLPITPMTKTSIPGSWSLNNIISMHK